MVDKRILCILLVALLSNDVCACLAGIDPALGANPSFFNMSEHLNREIYLQNISADEKFYLLIHNTFPEAPLLSNIRNYNTLLPFSCPPNGTDGVDTSYIHDAWLRIITVMPSVTDENGNYWVPSKGEVLAEYNYKIQLPRSATNVHPDCGVVYTLINHTQHLSIYANGLYLGNSTLANYELSSNRLKVNSELSISANVRKDHHISVCYCCKSGKEGCEATCCSCEFSNTEFELEDVALNHSIEREIYKLEASQELTMLQCPSNPLSTASGNFSVRSNIPIQSLFLSFGEANLSLQMHDLDIRNVLKPHNVLEAQAIPRVYELSQNMFVVDVDVSNETVLLNFTGIPLSELKAQHAKLILTDLFGNTYDLTNQTKITCPLNPEIELSVPRWAEKGSDFQAVVRLSEGGNSLPNKKVVVYYSGEEYIARTDANGEASFTLRANASLIETKSVYDGRYAEAGARRNLMVYDSSLFSYTLSALAFLFILVLSYIGFRFITGGGK